jgi:serine/threonine protein kinase/predicted Zn-dependent protease
MAIKCPKCQAENPETKQFCGDCGTQLASVKTAQPEVTETLHTPIKELATGSTFARRYQIIEELGKGGMGKVYRVLDKRLKEEVALKLIKPEIATDKETIERFSNELKLARRISHRNVGRMYELMEAEGTYFITMEYVPGQDLRRLIRQTGQLTTGKAISIARQVCEGLSEAHGLSVVHRDLKPGNILIDRDGNAKIMDFGIARTISDKGITGAGVMIGTPEYMSPEQVEGKKADQRSDIYSLGVILYEMVTGRVPFEGDTPLAIAVKHKVEVPQDPKLVNAQIPEDLSRVILRCLEKEKEKRYQSAEDIRSELENIEKGLPTTTHETTRRKPFSSRQITVTFKAKKLLIPTLGVLAVALLALFIWRFLPKKKFAPAPPSGKPSLAILYFENISGDKSLDPWKTALTELLITKLSQSKYINVLSSDRIFSLLKRLNLQEARKYSTEDLVKVATESGATYTLSGSLMKAGQNIIITLTLQKPSTGEVVSPLNMECSGEEEIFPKVDELSRTIKSDLNLTRDQIAADFDKEAGKITTSSPEAFKQYMEGWKYHQQLSYPQSLEYMKKAIAADPNFAMAYRTMAWAYRLTGKFDEQRDPLIKAFELKDRTSERERHLIEGDYYQIVEENLEKAIGSYKTLLEIYPDDLLGNFNLAQVYMEKLEEYDKAMPFLEVLVKNREEAIWVYIYLAQAYNAKGLYNKVKELYRFYLDNFSEDMRIHLGLAVNYIYLGEYDLVQAEYEKAMASMPDKSQLSMIKGYIETLKGNLEEAEKEFNKLRENKSPNIQISAMTRLIPLYYLQGKFSKSESLIEELKGLIGKLGNQTWPLRIYHTAQAHIYLETGRVRDALVEYDKLRDIAIEQEDLSIQTEALEGKAFAFLKLKEIGRAQETTNELKSFLEKEKNKKLMRHYYRLVGMIEYERENFSPAIVSLEKALSLVSAGPQDTPPDFIEPLALAYYRAGDMNRAGEEYEKITRITMGRIDSGNIYAKSFYMLGKIYEQQGKKTRAIENYAKFLDLWKDADPGLPEPEDARKRLAGMK